MPRALRKNELEQLALEPGERVLAEAERNLFPYWAGIGALGAAFIVYGVSDPRYGWGVFFLGLVLISFLGGIVSSVRYFRTDRRFVRIGALGKRSVRVATATFERAPGAFGETVTATEGDLVLRARLVKNADALVGRAQKVVA